jgi:hypothetical protein
MEFLELLARKGGGRLIWNATKQDPPALGDDQCSVAEGM